jgi:hypothetical protein
MHDPLESAAVCMSAADLGLGLGGAGEDGDRWLSWLDGAVSRGGVQLTRCKLILPEAQPC